MGFYCETVSERAAEMLKVNQIVSHLMEFIREGAKIYTCWKLENIERIWKVQKKVFNKEQKCMYCKFSLYYLVLPWKTKHILSFQKQTWFQIFCPFVATEILQAQWHFFSTVRFKLQFHFSHIQKQYKIFLSDSVLIFNIEI